MKVIPCDDCYLVFPNCYIETAEERVVVYKYNLTHINYGWTRKMQEKFNTYCEDSGQRMKAMILAHD